MTVNQIAAGQLIEVPRALATCPECGGDLLFQVNEWETDSRKPTDGGVTVDCVNEPDVDDPDFWDKQHRGYQSDWLPVIVRVTAHARRNYRIQTPVETPPCTGR